MSVFGILGAVGGAFLAALVAVIVRFNIQRAKARRAAVAIPKEACREVLRLIDEAGAASGAAVLLLRANSESDSGSRIGGVPRFAYGDAWPRDETGTPAQFLAQVVLQAPPLPNFWQGYVVSLFVGSTGVIARITAPPLPSGSLGRVDPSHVLPETPLMSLRLPAPPRADGQEETSPYKPSVLCRCVPEVRDTLRRYTDRPERVLPYLLAPGISTFEIDTCHVSLMGGDPELIQSDHGAACTTCGAPMRFLFQMGDVFGGAIPGDAPVAYVYGCDEHLDTVQAFVDVY